MHSLGIHCLSMQLFLITFCMLNTVRLFPYFGVIQSINQSLFITYFMLDYPL